MADRYFDENGNLVFRLSPGEDDYQSDDESDDMSMSDDDEVKPVAGGYGATTQAPLNDDDWMAAQNSIPQLAAKVRQLHEQKFQLETLFIDRPEMKPQVQSQHAQIIAELNATLAMLADARAREEKAPIRRDAGMLQKPAMRSSARRIGSQPPPRNPVTGRFMRRGTARA